MSKQDLCFSLLSNGFMVPTKPPGLGLRDTTARRYYSDEMRDLPGSSTRNLLEEEKARGVTHMCLSLHHNTKELPRLYR